jgi:septal ring factor EnvC (AmiA/AmiB activator)
MKNHRLKVMAMSAVLSTGFMAGTALAQQVDTVLQEGAEKVANQKASQQRVDKIADEAYDLLQEYKTVNKQIEGLRVYNAQLDRQIANQNQTIADLQESIENATLMERQIMPLTVRMLDGLEEFVKLDLPFKREERLQAIQDVRENLDSSRFSAAEKFRQVLELYDIESEYSRTVDQFEGTAEIDGQERQVNFLRVGRIALLYQTPNQDITGVWDDEANAWQQANEFRSAVSKGIRIAKKQAAIDILTLPIPAPEAAQ